MKHYIDNNWKRYLCLLLCITLICAIFGCGYEKKEKSYKETSELATNEYTNDENVEIEQSTDNNKNEEEISQTDVTNVLDFHLLDVEQGTSVLVNCDGYWLLYDGGNSGTSSYVVAYLKKQGVKKLDYIIASHFDADHISGLIGALNVFECETVLSPDYEADTKIYNSFDNMVKKNGALVIHPKQGDNYYFGNAEIEIVGPYTYSYSEENDRSICVRITYGNTHFLMCGDAEYPAESDMVNSGVSLCSDVFVVSHHGSANSNSTAFLNVVNPQYALISCELGNSYGHPSDEALKRLREAGCLLYRTDLQKEIIGYSDGINVWFNQEATSDWRAGPELEKDDFVKNKDNQNQTIEVENNNIDYQYVCNTSTMKFHYCYCNSVSKMSDKNKKYTNETREELIEQGYTSCGNCNP